MRQSAVAIGILCLLTVANAQPTRAHPDSVGVEGEAITTAVRKAVSTAWQEHIAAAKRKDLGGVTRIYDDDVIYVVPGEQDARGRAAIDRMEERALGEADLLDAEHTTESLKVFGGIAYEIGTVIGPIRPRGKDTETVSFHFMAMWRRQADGSWRILSFVGQSE